jgi:hypothetical protein
MIYKIIRIYRLILWNYINSLTSHVQNAPSIRNRTGVK